MNPILPIEHFVPDVEARVWQDGRIYLYGSYDIAGDSRYCSREYHVFSSADLATWTDHGVSFTGSTAHTAGSAAPNTRLFAPDCVYRNGEYYLYYCGSDHSEGVAVSNNPEGPFYDARPIGGVDGDGIDPAVLVDDDGLSYYFWGQFELRGAQLADDMCTVVPETIDREILTEALHGFHEGACIRKRDGRYYLLYTDISRGRATCLSYATAESPLGPYTKGGVIIDNTGCDPETWNNHGSIQCFGDRWYLFYHRSTQGSRYSRRVCVEPIVFNSDGSIDEVVMTSQGAGPPLDPTEWTEAAESCELSGETRVSTSPPDVWCDSWRDSLTRIHDGDWAAYRYFDFDEPCTSGSADGHPLHDAMRYTSCEVSAGALGEDGVVEIRLDAPDGEIVARVSIEPTGGWQKWRDFSGAVIDSSVCTGVRALYLVFHGSGGRLFDLRRFRFHTSR